MACDIFISYSSEDNIKKNQIYFNLLYNFGRRTIEHTEKQLSIFCASYSLHPGDLWDPRIMKEARECKLFLLLATENALKSSWVIKEIKQALSSKAVVVYVLAFQKDICKAFDKKINGKEELTKRHITEINTSLKAQMMSILNDIHNIFKENYNWDLSRGPFQYYEANGFVPQIPENFVPRPELEARIKSLCFETKDDQRHCALLVGCDGIGKTTIAHHCLRDHSISTGQAVFEIHCTNDKVFNEDITRFICEREEYKLSLDPDDQRSNHSDKLVVFTQVVDRMTEKAVVLFDDVREEATLDRIYKCFVKSNRVCIITTPLESTARIKLEKETVKIPGFSLDEAKELLGKSIRSESEIMELNDFCEGVPLTLELSRHYIIDHTALPVPDYIKQVPGTLFKNDDTNVTTSPGSTLKRVYKLIWDSVKNENNPLALRLMEWSALLDAGTLTKGTLKEIAQSYLGGPKRVGPEIQGAFTQSLEVLTRYSLYVWISDDEKDENKRLVIPVISQITIKKIIEAECESDELTRLRNEISKWLCKRWDQCIRSEYRYDRNQILLRNAKNMLDTPLKNRIRRCTLYQIVLESGYFWGDNDNLRWAKGNLETLVRNPKIASSVAGVMYHLFAAMIAEGTREIDVANSSLEIVSDFFHPKETKDEYPIRYIMYKLTKAFVIDDCKLTEQTIEAVNDGLSANNEYGIYIDKNVFTELEKEFNTILIHVVANQGDYCQALRISKQIVNGFIEKNLIKIEIDENGNKTVIPPDYQYAIANEAYYSFLNSDQKYTGHFTETGLKEMQGYLGQLEHSIQVMRQNSVLQYDLPYFYAMLCSAYYTLSQYYDINDDNKYKSIYLDACINTSDKAREYIRDLKLKKHTAIIKLVKYKMLALSDFCEWLDVVRTYESQEPIINANWKESGKPIYSLLTIENLYRVAKAELAETYRILS